MIAIIKIVGLMTAVIGGLVLHKPRRLKKMLASMSEGTRVYKITGIKFAFGILLLLNADKCHLAGFIKFVGFITTVGTALFFVLGKEKMDAYVNWWQKRSFPVIRAWAILTILFGMVLVYAA